MRWAILPLLIVPGLLAAAAPDCKLIRIEEWQVRVEGHLPTVDGEINGSRVAIALDTGAERSQMTRPAATRLALTRYDVPGPRAAEAVRIDELKLGSGIRKNWSVLVAPEYDFATDVSLILGQDFFYATDLELDFANRAVRFFQPKDCEGVSLAYWARDGSASDIRLESGSRIMFGVSINGRPLRAALDTGAAVSSLAMTEASLFGLTPKSPGVVAAGCSLRIGRKPVDYWSGPVESFAIGNEVIRNPSMRFGETAIEAASQFALVPQMVLGMDFLRAHRVLVSNSQRRLYFSYVGGTVFPPGPIKGCQDLR